MSLDKQQDPLRGTSITGKDPNDPRVIERDILFTFEKLKTEEDPSEIQRLKTEFEKFQDKLEDVNIDKAFEELDKNVATNSRLPTKGKEKVKKFMKEIFKNLTSPAKLLEDISLVGLSEEDKMVLVGEVSTSIRNYLFGMGYIIALMLSPNIPGLGPVKKASELMMKIRDDTEKKLSNARLRRDVDKLLKNVESIMKSLAISDAVSAKRYNTSKESKTSGQVEQDSTPTKTVSPSVEQDSTPTETVSPPVEQDSTPTKTVSPSVEQDSTPTEQDSTPQATTGVGGGRKKRINKTKRRTKGKKNKTKRKKKTKHKKKTKRRRN